MGETALAALYEQARAAAAAGDDTPGAIAKYREVLAHWPVDVEPDALAQVFFELGVLYAQAESFPESSACMNQAVRLDPLHRKAHQVLQSLREALEPPPRRAELERYLLELFGADPGARGYVTVHLPRFAATLRLLSEGRPDQRLLELGANKFFSALLRRYAKYSLCYSDWWPDPATEPEKDVTIPAAGPEGSFSMHLHNFNVERDRFPFDDGSFDVVLACEILEHLPNDPMFMFVEAGRVLRPGGRLILTTPNITSYRSLDAAVNGFPPYVYNKFSKAGSPRHCKEYAPRELRLLLERSGFEVETLRTENVWIDVEDGVDYWGRYRNVRDWLRTIGASLEDRGEDIFAVGVKRGTCTDRYPVELYD